MLPTQTFEKTPSRELLDVLIRAGLIAVLVVSCFEIFSPFFYLVLWSLILSITLYPLHGRLKRRLGNRDGRASTVIVLVAVSLALVPVYLLGASISESVQNAMVMVKDGTFHIPPPAESVAGWPVIGKPLYDFWVQAAADLTSLAHKFAPQLKDASLTLLSKAASLGMEFLLFIAALIIAGIIMAHGEQGEASAVRIASRISGPEKGPRIISLGTATVRAAAQGVVGIAFIQMLLVGVAFVVKGIPGAGLLALGVLLLGIIQLPVSLITLPVIAFIFLTEGATVGAIVFAVYVFIAGLADNVLKPLLLGRGVDVPMPVVLIGAIGGMVTSGIIGLFIGPVTLAVGYMLFWQWVDEQPQVRPPVTQERA